MTCIREVAASGMWLAKDKVVLLCFLAVVSACFRKELREQRTASFICYITQRGVAYRPFPRPDGL